MKDNLLNLIDYKNKVETDFYTKATNSNRFIKWKKELVCELEEIYESTKDKAAWEALVLLKQHFDGYNDREDFYSLCGVLEYIKNNINKYYPKEEMHRLTVGMDFSSNKKDTHSNKKPKIFISHSSDDQGYTYPFVELLESLGIKKEHIIYTSISEYGIPLDEDIYDYLKNQFQNYNIHIFFMLSDNYYKSPACLNEMGAAWVLQNKYTTILLPNFELKEIKGAINPRQIGLKFDENLTTVKERLGKLKDNLIQEFNLQQISDAFWERKRDDFINKIRNNNRTIHIESENFI